MSANEVSHDVKKKQFRRNSTLTRKLSETLHACPEHIEGRRLTRRDREIIAALLRGAANKEIARALSISTRTVERHIGNVYTKIGAHNRAQATAYAFRHGTST